MIRLQGKNNIFEEAKTKTGKQLYQLIIHFPRNSRYEMFSNLRIYTICEIYSLSSKGINFLEKFFGNQISSLIPTYYMRQLIR